MALLQVNPSCPIYFAGWETTTVALGQQGWKLSLEDDIYRDEKKLLLFHPKSNLKMLAISRGYYRYMEQDRFNDARFDHRFRDEYEQRWNGPDFTVVQASNDILFRVTHEVLMPRFNHWADTRPTMVDYHEMKLSEIPLFTALEKPPPATQELIVEPQDVYSLLERIRSMQAPGQAEIRRRNPALTPQYHASILTFPGAA
jgi:hypothetical protein